MSTARKQYSRKLAAILTVLAMVLALFPVAAFAADGYFKDVGGTLAAEINKAYEAGLVTGYKDGTFRPNEPVTRAAFAKMIVLAVEKATGEELPGGDEPFSDVRPGQALYEYVVKAYNKGYIKGYPDGTFGYNKTINRQEAAAILQRALDLPLKAENFKDVPDNSGFAKQIGAVAAAGIMKGYGAEFKPAELLNRAQAAAVAYRAFEYLGGKKPEEKLYEVTAVEQASDSSLRVKFNQAVEDTSAVEFEVKRAGQAVEVTPEWAEDKTSVELKAASTLLNGTYTVTVSGPNFAEGKNSGQVEVKTKFAVASITALNAKQVQIRFTKPVVKDTVIDSDGTLASRFSFTPLQTQATTGRSNAVDADGSSAELSADGAVITVTAPGFDLASTKYYFDGQYAVTINEGVKSIDGDELGAYSAIHTLTDTSRPTVVDKTVNAAGEVILTFSEPVDEADQAGAYELTSGNGSIEDLAYVSGSNNTKVKFRIVAPDNETVSGKTYTFLVKGVVKDFAGNLISPNPTLVTVTVPNDTTKPTVTSIQALDLNTLKITFSEAIDTNSSITIAIDGKDATIAKKQWSNGDTQLTVDLDPSDEDVPTTGGLYQVTIAGYTDIAGNTGDPVSKFVTFKEDTTKPKLSKVSVTTIDDKRHIVVVFDEPVEIATAQALDAVRVYDGVEYPAIQIPSNHISGHDADGDGTDDSIKIWTVDSSGNELPVGEWTIQVPGGLVKDKSDNANTNDPFEFVVTLGTIGDQEKPYVKRVFVQDSTKGLDNNSVVVEFNEDVTNETALNPANYTVEGKAVFTKAVFQGNKKTVKLTLAEGSITASGPMEFEIKNVRDFAGNVIDPVKRVENFTENVRPTLESVTLKSKTSVLLTFSEPVALVDQGGLKVAVNGNEATIRSVVDDQNNPVTSTTYVKTWLVTFDPGAQEADDVVSVSISGESYEDQAGNQGKSATFSVKVPVEN